MLNQAKRLIVKWNNFTALRVLSMYRSYLIIASLINQTIIDLRIVISDSINIVKVYCPETKVKWKGN